MPDPTPECDETPRPLPWLPGYRVGPDGSVYGVGLIYRPRPDSGDPAPPTVFVRLTPGQPRILVGVARLVLLAFAPPAWSRSVPHYRDGRPANVAAANLSWAPDPDADPAAPAHGTKAERHAEIRRLIAEGLTQSQVAKRVRVSQSQVSSLLRRDAAAKLVPAPAP